MARLCFALACVLALGTTGCGDDSSTGTDGGGGGTDGGGGGTDGGGGGTDGGGGGTDGEVTTDAGGGGTACTSPLVGCEASEYCDFPDDLCGMGVPGVCRPRPTTCGSEDEVTCNCQPLIFMNGCMAQMGGYDLNNNATCTPPAETFACGHRVCRQNMEYCQRTTSDVGGMADEYTCINLPSGCSGSVSCACVASETCGDMCEASADGDLTVTCPGG